MYIWELGAKLASRKFIRTKLYIKTKSSNIISGLFLGDVDFSADALFIFFIGVQLMPTMQTGWVISLSLQVTPGSRSLMTNFPPSRVVDSTMDIRQLVSGDGSRVCHRPSEEHMFLCPLTTLSIVWSCAKWRFSEVCNNYHVTIAIYFTSIKKLILSGNPLRSIYTFNSWNLLSSACVEWIWLHKEKWKHWLWLWISNWTCDTNISGLQC